MHARRRRDRLVRGRAAALAAVLAAALLAAAALAQALPGEAAEALQRGQREAARALASYEHHRPDQPLWEAALAAGEEAADLAPDHPAPRRFLAQSYLQLGWYARSWSNWQAYLARGGTVDAAVERQLLEVAEWMGLNAFEAGRREEAVGYLETVLRFRPDHLAANARLARYHLDRDEPLAALPHLEALDGRVPGLDAQLRRARRIERFGAAAVAAYRDGLDRLNAGAPEAALERFLDAAGLAADFADAWRRAGATAERLGRPEVARDAYRRALEAAPEDAEALAGLGRLALADDDLEAAAGWFERAAVAAPDAQAYEQARAETQRRLDERTAEEEAQARAAAEAEARAAEAEAERRAQAEAERRAADAEAARQAADEAAADAEPGDRADAERRAAEEAARREAEARAEAEAEAQRQAEARAEAEAEAERQAEARADAERRAEEARREAEEAARRAAEEEAARQAEARARAEAEAQADAERQARADAEARARAARESLVVLDAPVQHRRGTPGPSPSLAFFDAPGLATDLRGRAGDVLHVRLDVQDKPSDELVRYQLCLVPTDVTVAPACTDPTLLAFASRGTYEAQQPWSSLAGFSAIDWQDGIDSVMLVLRRRDGAAVDAPVAGGADEVDLDAYLPMRVRVRAVAVPEGAPFPGWP